LELLGDVFCLILYYYACACCLLVGDLPSLRFLIDDCLGYFLFLEALVGALVPLAYFSRWAREMVFSIVLPTRLVIETIKIL
jgi:hypothetical protein